MKTKRPRGGHILIEDVSGIIATRDRWTKQARPIAHFHTANRNLRHQLERTGRPHTRLFNTFMKLQRKSHIQPLPAFFLNAVNISYSQETLSTCKFVKCQVSYTKNRSINQHLNKKSIIWANKNFTDQFTCENHSGMTTAKGIHGNELQPSSTTSNPLPPRISKQIERSNDKSWTWDQMSNISDQNTRAHLSRADHTGMASAGARIRACNLTWTLTHFTVLPPPKRFRWYLCDIRSCLSFHQMRNNEWKMSIFETNKKHTQVHQAWDRKKTWGRTMRSRYIDHPTHDYSALMRLQRSKRIETPPRHFEKETVENR